ncbi:MAG: hypothetical protein WC807_16450 [Hyphomicrobium sp.]
MNRLMCVSAGFFLLMLGPADVIAQHAGSTNPQEQTVYQTKGIVLNAHDMADWAVASYWEQKLGAVYVLAVDPRMQADADERDAVLATAWQLRPQTISAKTAIIAIIPKRTTKPQSNDIAYQITFIPGSGAQDKHKIETRFISEGLGVRPILTSASAAGTIPRLPPIYSYAGFPQNNIARYWAAHPGELKSILHWIGTNASTDFNQILNTNVVEASVHRSAYFHLVGARTSSGPIARLRVVFLGSAIPVTSKLPQQDTSRDFGDLQIEKAQAEVDTQKHDTLGAITGLAELLPEERLPAKYALWQYFMKGTRNAEVDAIVPIPNTEKRVLLTFRFGTGNNVGVQRVGEDNKGSSFRHLGDVRLVNGFGANSADIPAWMAWVKRRYPSVTPIGVTMAELVNSVTAEIKLRSGTAAWFKENYGIEILAPSVARSQLARSFQFSDQQLMALRAFTSSELQMLEFTLEKMSDPLVSIFRGMKMARQKTSVELIGVTSTKFAISEPAEAGMALLRGNNRLVVIFDSGDLNSEALFLGGAGAGGKPEVATEALMVYAHELGHLVAAMPGMKDGFDGLVKTKKIKAVTWYAASNAETEFFPEAFALYIGDPEWLKRNRPDLFGWFQTLSRK